MYYMSQLTNKEQFLSRFGSQQANAVIYDIIKDDPFICTLDVNGNVDLIYTKGKWYHQKVNNPKRIVFSLYSSELHAWFKPLVKAPAVKHFDGRRAARLYCKENCNFKLVDKGNLLPERWTVVPKELKIPTDDFEFKWQSPVGARPNEGYQFSAARDHEISHLSVIRLVESKRKDFTKRNSLNEQVLDVVNNKAFCGMITADGYCSTILTGMKTKLTSDVGLDTLSNFLTSIEMFECFEEIVLPSFCSRAEARAFCDRDTRFQVFDLKKHEQDPSIALSYGKQKNRWWCVPRSVDTVSL